MQEAYSQFKNLKNQQHQATIKSRAESTLEWYERIGTMIDEPMYEYCYDFLQSVAQYIETKEMISEKQIEAIQNILDQTQNLDFKNYKRSPF